MTEVPESGEERIDESGRNPTQQRMDEEGPESTPVDAGWQEDGADETLPDAVEAADEEEPEPGEPD